MGKLFRNYYPERNSTAGAYQAQAGIHSASHACSAKSFNQEDVWYVKTQETNTASDEGDR